MSETNPNNEQQNQMQAQQQDIIDQQNSADVNQNSGIAGG